MFKKNSIFIRVLVPVVLVMLFQSLLISLVLRIGGIFDSLDQSELDSLGQNMETRAFTLENMMTHYWSNLGKLESDILRSIDDYRTEHSLNLDDILHSYDRKNEILGDVSSYMINALRVTTSTGIFFYFVDEGDAYSKTPVNCNGLYYRDWDSVYTPNDNSDIQYLRGHVNIARKDRIQLDSAWTEAFVFSPDNTDAWNSFAKPQIAAERYPGISSADLAYWSRPFALDNDGRKFITYTLPVVYEGRVIAMLGSEMQMSQLEKLFPASDFSDNGKSGYMLLKYDANEQDEWPCDVLAVTGAYIKRVVSEGDTTTLSPSSRNDVYTLAEASERVEIILRPLHLYNNNAPYSGDRWALAAIGTDSVLFETSREVRQGLLISSMVALLIGVIVLAFVLTFSTRPLIALANRIRKGEPIITTASSTYEVELLSTTINDMKEKRREAEARLMEERERYMIALESTDDTFLEYDVSEDLLRFFYFSGSGELQVRDFEHFHLCASTLFPAEDVEAALRFVRDESEKVIELRVAQPLFLYNTSYVTDNGYRWFRVSVTHIRSSSGEYVKLIGTAREITAAKLREFAEIETLRRDISTGFYNRDYAVQRLGQVQINGGILCLQLGGFERLETCRGRYFAAVVLREFCNRLRLLIGSSDRAVRLSNDELMLVLYSSSRDELFSKCADIFDTLSALYTGEDDDAELSVRIGVAVGNGTNGAELLQNARKAACAADENTALDYDLLDPALKAAAHTEPYAPISAELDISPGNITNFVFELLERTADVHSAIKALLPILGQTFNLRRVAVCSFDVDFGSNGVAYQWAADGIEPLPDRIDKISHADFQTFESLLDENGVMSFDASSSAQYSEGVRQLLCAGDGTVTYCCAMTENGVQSGRALFVSDLAGYVWSDAECLEFYEITKIIAAHLNIERSNSASRAKSEFLSRISHEIRTPMNAIIGMTAIAKAAGERERLDDALDKIDFSAKHLLSLINDVLEMSRIEQGKLQVEEAPFSVGEFIEGIETLTRPSIEQKGISLEIRNSTKHDVLVGDEYRLRQVIINFIGNAGKFTKAGGSIVFSVEELSSDDETASLRFSVADNGIGISREEQPFIFNAFEQAHSAGAERQGTGLGLTISSNIISAMGSTIELESEQGRGSEFSFVLRLAISEENGSGEVAAQSYAGRLSGRRVLLAEDNEINIEIAAYILEESGALVEVARNGAEAVEMFMASEIGYYDIIIMDIQMPVMDGLAATRSIRKQTERADARSVPIIAMTANAFDRDMKKSIESGMNGHVAKPIDSAKLFGLTDKLLLQKGGDTT